MKVIVCENNLAGFLTAVYHRYYTVKDAETVVSTDFELSFLDEPFYFDTEVALANRVRNGLINKIGFDGYQDIADAYLSCNPQKEQIIFKYVISVFKHGRKIARMFSLPEVIDFLDIIRKVRNEAHRMHMFLRFQEMSNGAFYSFFGSDNDVIELVVPHFAARFNTEKFVIHDIKRKKMILFDGKETHKLIAPDNVEIELSENEPLFLELWKQYFENIAVEGRTNYKLQRGFAPKKYRFFMNEF